MGVSPRLFYAGEMEWILLWIRMGLKIKKWNTFFYIAIMRVREMLTFISFSYSPTPIYIAYYIYINIYSILGIHFKIALRCDVRRIERRRREENGTRWLYKNEV